MARPVYLATSGLTEAFVYKFVGGLDLIDVGADVYISHKMISRLVAGDVSATQDFFELFDLYGVGGMTPPVTDPNDIENGAGEGIFIGHDGAGPPYALLWHPEQGANIDGPIGEGWHSIDLHLEISTDTEVFVIDGVTYDLSGAGLFPSVMSQIDVVAFGSIYAGGNPQTYIRNPRIGTTGLGSTDLMSDDFATGDFSLWDGTFGPVTLSDVLPASASRRFYTPPVWRWVLANMEMATIACIEQVATSKLITRSLNVPWTASGDAPSEHPLISTPREDDEQPFLARNIRILIGLRQPNDDPFEPYVPEYTGIVLQIQDQAAAGGAARSTFTAFDPRKLLYARPCLNAAGKPPGASGFKHTQLGLGRLRVDELALLYLKNTIDIDGPVFIDAGTDYSGTAFHTGTLEHIGDPIDYTIEQGLTVGQLWDDLNQRGLCDIKLTPIYDPSNRPGYLSDLTVVAQLGTDRNGAVFAWDLLPQSLAGITRLEDGTPDQLANSIQFYARGVPVPVKEDSASIAAFGRFVSQQFFDQDQAAAVEAWAELTLAIRKQGRTVVTLNPTPERAPVPIEEYDIGDRVPVYASAKLRLPLNGIVRVTGIPIAIADNTTETVDQLLTSADGIG